MKKIGSFAISRRRKVPPSIVLIWNYICPYFPDCYYCLMLLFERISFSFVLLVGWLCLLAGSSSGQTELVDSTEASEAPYTYLGRTFTGDFSSGPHGEATATAVGPGVILTAAHVLWTNSPNTIRLPWENYRRWHPGVSSENDPSYTNVVSIVSLTGYADAIDRYDFNHFDGGSPKEVFNRDAMVLIFSDDSATPYGFARAHPRAYQSGFLYDKHYYQVAGYPSGKYVRGDLRGWRVHRTASKNRLWLREESEDQFEPGYQYENRLFTGGQALDTESGNSGGPLFARTKDGEPWLIAGVVVGENSLFRTMDQELSDLIDTAIVGQVENDQSRFRFKEQEVEAIEGGEQPRIMVERIGDLSNPASVSVHFADIGTSEETDYLSSAILAWEAEEGGEKALELEILDDELREGVETLLMILDPDEGSTLDAPHTAHLKVIDNDLDEPLDQWVALEAFEDDTVWKIVFAEGKFVGIGGQEANWWSHDLTESGGSDFSSFRFLDSLNYLDGKFVAAGAAPSVLVSEDGVDWQSVSLPTGYNVVDVAYGNGTYVAVGGYSSFYYWEDLGIIWNSSDVQEWTQVYEEFHFSFRGIAFGQGRFLAWTWDELLTSTDGLSWTVVQMPEEMTIVNDIAWGENHFVAADNEGNIFRSADGITWTPTEVRDGLPLYSVTYRNGYFIVAGRKGRILTSEDDGFTWAERYTELRETLVQGLSAAGKMIVAGDGLVLGAELGDYVEFLKEQEIEQISMGDSVAFGGDFVSSIEEGLSLQWQKDGHPIEGATERILSLDSAYSSDAGHYRLAVSRDNQSWYSPGVHLTLDKQQEPPNLLQAATQSSYGVTLAWEDHSSHEEEYRIERRKMGSEGWDWVAALPVDSTRYIDRNLNPETGYQYRISAVAGADEVSILTDMIYTLPATNLVNLSTRGLVGKGDDVMIGGFVIPDGPEMTLYLRGLGPSLEGSGILNAISDPSLTLVQTGTNETVETTNDNWVNSADRQAIEESGLPPTADNESAMFVTLNPGSYTAILSNQGEESFGVGLIEIYDVTTGCESCRLTNLSTRGVVKGGDDLMIGGLVVLGEAGKQILVRGLGPSLTQVEGALEDPVLKMVTGDGEEFLIDDWSQSNRADEFAELGLAMDHEREAADIYQVSEGTYTFQILGQNDGEGVALLEIFEVD